MGKIRRCNAQCEYYLQFPDKSGRCFYEIKERTVQPQAECIHNLLTEIAQRKISGPEDNLFRDIYHRKE